MREWQRVWRVRWRDEGVGCGFLVCGDPSGEGDNFSFFLWCCGCGGLGCCGGQKVISRQVKSLSASFC